MKNDKKYTPKQIGSILHKTIERYKKESDEVANYMEAKATWVKNTANKIVDLLNSEVKKFNQINPKNIISAKDINTVLRTAIAAIGKLVTKKG